MAIDLSKQRTLDAYQKVIEQINFTANLYWDGNTTMLFILKEVKETVKISHKELLNYCECVPYFYFVL